MLYVYACYTTKVDSSCYILMTIPNFLFIIVVFLIGLLLSDFMFDYYVFIMLLCSCDIMLFQLDLLTTTYLNIHNAVDLLHISLHFSSNGYLK